MPGPVQHLDAVDRAIEAAVAGAHASAHGDRPAHRPTLAYGSWARRAHLRRRARP